MEKYAKDLEGFLGSSSLPRSNFFVPLCKDNRSPQLRVFPAWGSPQMAKLASKLTSHSAGCGGGGLSPADGEESDSEKDSQKSGQTLLVSAALWCWLWSQCSRCWCESGCLLSPSSFCPLQGKIPHRNPRGWPPNSHPQPGYCRRAQGCRCLQDKALCQGCRGEDTGSKIYECCSCYCIHRGDRVLIRAIASIVPQASVPFQQGEGRTPKLLLVRYPLAGL